MAQRALRRSEQRAALLLIILASLLMTVGVRLIFVQVVEAKKYKKLALKQHLRCVDLTSRRGTIYDSEGQELAISVDADTIYATPYLIKHPQRVASSLSSILGTNESELLQKLTKDTGFVYLARKVERDKAKEVEALEIEGIGLLKESKRCYPLEGLGSQVIGFVGTDNNGLAGLELQNDKVLKGQPGKLLAEKDPLGRAIPAGTFELAPPEDGSSITITIDKDIQYRAEQELEACVKYYRALSGTVIVMNPKTGEIYAMANEPSFNLNEFSKVSADVRRNRAVTDTFEPGSTMKVVTASAALEEKLCGPESSFSLPGTIRVGNKQVKEAHERGARNFTFSQIVSKSSNVGAVTLGLKLGKEKLYEYIDVFGLTKKTEVDFPGEISGYTPMPAQWYSTTIANVPFGQGISATPLQMTQVFAAIANNGLVFRPHLLSEVITSQGFVKKVPQDQGRKVLSSRTAGQMRVILEQAVSEGTGKEAAIPGYSVAGKTGTAQKPGRGGYQAGKYVASFIGFAPAQDPQVLVLVSIDEPQSAIYGGAVAAPIFKNVTEFSLHHLRIPPELAE